jgi:hypothetical protein
MPSAQLRQRRTCCSSRTPGRPLVLFKQLILQSKLVRHKIVAIAKCEVLSRSLPMARFRAVAGPTRSVFTERNRSPSKFLRRLLSRLVASVDPFSARISFQSSKDWTSTPRKQRPSAQQRLSVGKITEILGAAGIKPPDLQVAENAPTAPGRRHPLFRGRRRRI